MRFIDEALITIRSGRGGRGLVSFRREKYVPRGGPNGGDGGRGGDVVVAADLGLKTLLDYHYHRKHKAEDGAPGGANNCTGKSGKPLVLKVPVGTLVADAETGEVLADIATSTDEVVLLQGGRPGRGNSHFALPWRQAPDFTIPPGEGQERTVRLELKLVADIGIVGLPNAGKSTLINRISQAKARVADYPFTTIVPNLGVVSLGPDRTFIVADLPGLISGAAEGAGLGLQFLRHCERTRALVHMVDCSSEQDPVSAFRTVRHELASHGAAIDEKPFVLVASKLDQAPGDEAAAALEAHAVEIGVPFFRISSLTGAGIQPLVERMALLAGIGGRPSEF